MKCYTRQIGEHQVMCYSYRPSYDALCVFNLMSEVGEPYQKQMRDLANSLASANNAKIVTKEIEVAPWYVDVMEKV